MRKATTTEVIVKVISYAVIGAAGVMIISDAIINGSNL